MAKRVNNIAYKGINHSPSLVSDNDGHASECVNLSPDYNDLKPMPMPVKKNGYTVTFGAKLVYVHQGVGYENYVELNGTNQLYLRDAEGHYLYYSSGSPDWPWWWNEGSEPAGDILAVESMGDTLIVSTTTGVEYLIYQPDVPLYGSGASGSYKWIGQKPPMPVIEFNLSYVDNGVGDSVKYKESENNILKEDGNPITMYSNGGIGEDEELYLVKGEDEELVTSITKGLMTKLENEVTLDNYFIQPFFVRYAFRTRSGDYIMQSPQVLMLPSTDKCPILVRLSTHMYSTTLNTITTSVKAHKLQYKVKNNERYDDWSDIISGLDIFVSIIPNYNIDAIREFFSTVTINDNQKQAIIIPRSKRIDLGQSYHDGEITDLIDDLYNFLDFAYPVKNIGSETFHKRVRDNSLFHKVASLDLSDLTQMQTHEDLPIENLSNLSTLPTLEDDYNSHCAISPSLMQVYNSRLNMANINQKVFKGFANGFQPQSVEIPHVGRCYTDPSDNKHYFVHCAYFKVKKNGKTYVVQSDYGTSVDKLDYTTYLYYPDPDCYEAVFLVGWTAVGMDKWLTVPMKRHEYLNGSYWYDDMKCLGEYLKDNMASTTGPTQPFTLSTDLWYNIPNRFMMSSVGNPWHFPIGNQFDIGRREIRALSLNAENMDAPQFGQNPLYIFSADGIWTIAINADGTFNKLSYVSGDVVSEMATLGSSPTASGTQVVFFKTSRGVSAIVGSAVKEIDLVMKGRLFNPRTMLLPQGSIVDGVPTSGIDSYWLDIIFKSCDSLPYADFARQSNLLYDYRNDRLLLYNKAVAYMYVYDIKRDFWSKMLPLVVDESGESPAQEQYNTRGNIQTLTQFNGTAMVGNNAILTDSEGYLWDVGGQPDENDIEGHHFGLYVSRPLRFGTDDMKTLSRIVHDHQLGSTGEAVKMALYGSRNGKDYYQIKTLRGTAYKFYIIVLYTKMLASSRYAYTAFEWEARMTDKIR